MSLLADQNTTRAYLKQNFPYFKMAQFHEDMFMEEFSDFLNKEREGLFLSLYRVNSDLNEDQISERVATIGLINRTYTGADRIEHLTAFFSLDKHLPEDVVEEIKGYLAYVLVHSIRLGWGEA